MVFIAYNFFRYKYHSEENINFRKLVVDTVKKKFPDQKYILPYSQYSRQGLMDLLECGEMEITGTFANDIEYIVSRCSNLVFFPTEDNNIGSGVFFEITFGKKNGIPCYCYNHKTADITLNYELIANDYLSDAGLNSIFYKKVVFKN